MTAFHPRGIPSEACRFSCFFCAAYRLLLTQTRTRCSNSASRAIAMLEKTAKISPNVCAGISLSNECGHVENSYVFINNTNFEFYTLFCLVYHPTKDTANKVEGSICTYRQLSIIKVRISPLPRADLWQIFAGLASIAIALQTLFEHRVRVCL